MPGIMKELTINMVPSLSCLIGSLADLLSLKMILKSQIARISGCQNFSSSLLLVSFSSFKVAWSTAG